jgi:DNA-directed RNA polymerase subunit RPC12/RpoP
MFNKLIAYDILLHEESKRTLSAHAMVYWCSSCDHEFWLDNFLDDKVLFDQITHGVCPICGGELNLLNNY